MDVYTLPSVEWIAGGKQPQISSVLCDRLEGWDGEGGRRGGCRREEIWGRMCMYG